MAAVQFLHPLHKSQGLLEVGRLLVQEEVFLEAAGLQDVGEQVPGELQQLEPPADVPVDLKAEAGKNHHGHDTEKKQGDDPPPDFEGRLFHWGIPFSWELPWLARPAVYHRGDKRRYPQFGRPVKIIRST